MFLFVISLHGSILIPVWIAIHWSDSNIILLICLTCFYIVYLKGWRLTFYSSQIISHQVSSNVSRRPCRKHVNCNVKPLVLREGATTNSYLEKVGETFCGEKCGETQYAGRILRIYILSLTWNSLVSEIITFKVLFTFRKWLTRKSLAYSMAISRWFEYRCTAIQQNILSHPHPSLNGSQRPMPVFWYLSRPYETLLSIHKWQNPLSLPLRQSKLR